MSDTKMKNKIIYNGTVLIDLTVEAIPYAETDNAQGGVTVTIG